MHVLYVCSGRYKTHTYIHTQIHIYIWHICVGDGEVEGVVGKYGVPGENESGERLLDMCVEQ